MAYAEKRGKGPRPWRVKYKVPGGEASQSGFETKQAALGWGRDQEAKVRAGTWTDPGAGEITEAGVSPSIGDCGTRPPAWYIQPRQIRHARGAT